MNELRKELVILKELEIKPNYTELGRKYNCDPRTVKKYNNGYEGKSKTRKRNSKLDKYKEEIKEKINYVGSTIKGVYEYMKENNYDVGSYSNLKKYVKKEHLIDKKSKNNPHPRYETPLGQQLQFDWKESITMINKYGEKFEFVKLKRKCTGKKKKGLYR